MPAAMKYPPFHPHLGRSGFTLIELSVVLMIMSIILAGVLSFMAEKTDADKYKETERRMEVVEKALAGFLAENGRLPCPGLLADTPGAATFGKAARNATTDYLCDSSIAAMDEPAGSGNTTGVVPTKTLQISDEYAFDAWGRRINYNMQEKCNGALNDATSLSIHDFNNDTAGYCNEMYNILNTSGGSVKDTAIYVLVSYGKNGHGAHNHNGDVQINAYAAMATGASPDPVDASEKLNSRFKTNILASPLTAAGFVANGGSYVQKSRTPTFDDIVHYKTKAQLIREAGGMKGMAGGTVPPATIDPVCNMIQSKLATVVNQVIVGAATSFTTVPVNNPPSSATAQAVCGISTGVCASTMKALADKLYALCY
jgi:prepilin-type N-terminal cleavage/methylation domain-containing protein